MASRKRKPKTKRPPAQRGLSEKERRFVELFMGECKGNATDAARRAGYGGSDAVLNVTASRLLRKAKVKRAIDERVKADPHVKTREDLQRWWSEVVDDVRQKMKDRLKASELLGKTQAAFVERVEHKLEDGGQVHFYLPDNGRRPPAPEPTSDAATPATDPELELEQQSTEPPASE